MGMTATRRRARTGTVDGMVAQRPTFAGVRWAPAEQACGPFAQVLALLPNESSTDGCGQGHHAVSDFAALDREDGIGAGWHRGAGHDAYGMSGSSGAMSSCAAAATVL